MLDRYTITLSADELSLVLGVEVPEDYAPQYNAAPTKLLPVITSVRAQKLNLFHWGLMAMWTKNKSMSSKFFNLPANSVVSKSSYRKKLKTNRCVIPMDGFYLWKKVSKKKQVPYYFYYSDKKVFSVAGLWEENEENIPSFIMITKPADDQIFPFQENMPAILDAAATRRWLESSDIDELESLLQQNAHGTFVSHTVSPKIVNIDENTASFIQQAPASDQYGNYTLFT